MLEKGDQVPHFAVLTADRGRVAYGDIWQRRALLLVSMAPGEPDGDGSYVAQVAAGALAFAAEEAACVITHDTIPGVPVPSVLIADRWGEIQAVLPRRASEGPPPAELLEWLSWVRSRCPECEGEAH